MKSDTRSAVSTLVRPLTAASTAALLLLSVQPSARATTRAYVGPDNGLWSTAAGWSPGGVPVAGDDVTLGGHSAGTTDLHVTFNGAYSQALNTLTLDSSGLGGYMIFNQSQAGSIMYATTEFIGTNTAENTYNQSAGTNICQGLDLGFGTTGSNNYNLSGSAVLNAQYEIIGDSGSGVFNQTGGANTMVNTSSSPGTYDLDIAEAPNSQGTYNLSAGTLAVDAEIIGVDGTGTFNQTGGTNTAGLLWVGSGVTGAKGVYNLSGGTISGPVIIWNNSTFNLLPGGVFTSPLSIQSGGIFEVEGGSFNSQTSVQIAAGGSLYLNGNTINAGSIVSAGAVTNGSFGASTITTGQLTQTAGTIADNEGTISLVLNGPATSTLAGTNTYSGTTTINGNYVQALSGGAISPNSAFVVNSGTLDANGQNITVASLAGTGGVVNVGTGSLTLGSNNATTSYNGALAGTGAIFKNGTGQLTLNGGGTFIGTISVQSGNLAVGTLNGISTGSNVSLGNNTALNMSANQTLSSIQGTTSSAINFANFSTLTVGATATSSTFGADFTGFGTFVKTGGSNFTLGFGTSDSTANLDSVLVIDVNGGSLGLNKAAGTSAVAGPLNIGGGTVILGASNEIADSSLVTITAGALNLNGFNETIGGLTGTGGSVNLGGGTLTVSQTANTTYGGGLTGAGSFVKNGSGNLIVTGASTLGGAFTVNQGELTLQGPTSATAFTANSGGTLLFSGAAVNLNNGALLSNAGGTVQYSNSTVSNGFLRGSGTHTILFGGPSTFNGITTYNSTTIAQNGVATFNDFTNGGTLNNNNVAMTINGGTNASSGVINVNNTLNTQDFSSDGVITIASGGTLGNSGSNLVFGGGSETTINSGGTLSTASGTVINLYGALLVNSGTQNGVLDVNYGSTAKGSGVFGTVSVGTGGKFGNSGVAGGGEISGVAAFRLASSQSTLPLPFVGPQLSTAPGTITVGGLILGAGSTLGLNVQNATGSAGVGYDTIRDLGALTLTGANTPGNQIIISLSSLNASGNPGAAANFNASQAYQFIMVSAAGGITGYSADEFAVDTSGFTNVLNGGGFSVGESGGNLLLDFSPQGVPEPATWLGGALLLAGAIVRQRRASR